VLARTASSVADCRTSSLPLARTSILPPSRMASTCPIGPSGTRCKTLATAPTRCAEQLQAQLRLRRAIPAITSIPMRWPHPSAAVRRAVTALPERQFGKWHAGFFVKEHTPLYRGFNSSYGFLTGKAGGPHLQLQSTLPPRPLVSHWHLLRPEQERAQDPRTIASVFFRRW
jgi:hypothetical protein